jgi:preprotein translocase subunit SecA
VGGERAGLSGDFITEVMRRDAQEAYERREEEFGSEVMRELERRVVLSVLDRKWREHLYEMDYLREGIGLRGYGQRDPLVEYQREGYDMFSAMMEGIKEESVGSLFNLQVQVQENPIVEETQVGADAALAPGDSGAAGPAAPGGAGPVAAQGAPGVAPRGGPAAHGAHARGSARTEPARAGGPRTQPNAGARAGQAGQGGQGAQPAGGTRARPAAAGQAPAVPAGLAPRRSQQLSYSAPSVDGGAHVETSRGPAASDKFARVGRNDLCPCGSGRKYKRCHGDPRMRPDA